MSSEMKNQPFIGYEYKEIRVPAEKASMYIDCYENFGWEIDFNLSMTRDLHMITIRLKRNRKRMNRMELTRLQRNFEACMHELDMLEYSKHQTAIIWSITVGILGTAFMAGSVFAVTHEPPIIWLCVFLAIPAFAGWIAPVFIYKKVRQKKEDKVQPLIEETYSKIYELCEKGHDLL